MTLPHNELAIPLTKIQFILLYQKLSRNCTCNFMRALLSLEGIFDTIKFPVASFAISSLQLYIYN